MERVLGPPPARDDGPVAAAYLAVLPRLRAAEAITLLGAPTYLCIVVLHSQCNQWICWKRCSAKLRMALAATLLTVLLHLHAAKAMRPYPALCSFPHMQ